MAYTQCWTKSRYRGLASFQIYINSVICISLFIFNSHDKKKWYEPTLVVNKRKHDTAFKQITWSYSITTQGLWSNHSEYNLNKNYAIPIETNNTQESSSTGASLLGAAHRMKPYILAVVYFFGTYGSGANGGIGGSCSNVARCFKRASPAGYLTQKLGGALSTGCSSLGSRCRL